jgi:hypothetical protein
MIIRFEEHRGHIGSSGSVTWAYQEDNNSTQGAENEGPDGNEQVGDRLYEGTPGHTQREKLKDLLFDSPHSKAQRRED